MNVLVISLSHCHLGFLGCYGNTWIETPALDGLAARSCVFDQCFIDSTSALQVHRSWWSGRYAFEIDARPSEAKLLDVLDAIGSVRTAIIGNVSELLGGAELVRGFADRIQSGSDFPNDMGRLVETTGGWLDVHAGSNASLLWVDVDALGGPWVPPEPFDGMYACETDEAGENAASETATSARRHYASQISFLDAHLGALFDHVAEGRYAGDLGIIFASDSGMPLGEHGVVGLSPPILYEEAVHVPLMICLPDGRGSGMRSSSLVQPVDLMPTILELLDLPPMAARHGTNLLPTLQHGNALARRCAVTTSATACSLHTGQHHLIRPGALVPVSLGTSADEPFEESRTAPELYLKPEDRWDQHNVAAIYPDDVARLTSALECFPSAAGGDKLAVSETRCPQQHSAGTLAARQPIT